MPRSGGFNANETSARQAGELISSVLLAHAGAMEVDLAEKRQEKLTESNDAVIWRTSGPNKYWGQRGTTPCHDRRSNGGHGGRVGRHR